MDTPKGVKENLVYKNTPQRNLELTFLPPVEKKYEVAPIYFIISGGGWHVESKQSMLNFSARSVEALRNEGFAVVSIDYRVCTEGVVMSEIITDCFDAARYVSHFADVLGVDKNSFVLSGHSAGAHLALMLGFASADEFKGDYEFDDEFTVKCIAAMSPPTCLYDCQTHNLKDLSDLFVGCDTLEERKRTSPTNYVGKNCPSTLLCAGTSDYLVFSTSSENLYKKLKEAGADCDLVLSVGGGHCFEKVHDLVEPDVNLEKMQDIITKYALEKTKN
jgi:acetyl esterase/lipase